MEASRLSPCSIDDVGARELRDPGRVLLGREHRHDEAPGRLLLLVHQPPLDRRHGRQAAGLEPTDVLELELHVPRALLLGQHVEPSLDRPVVLLRDGVGELLIAPDPPRHLDRLRLQLAHDLLRHGLRLREPSVGLAALRGDDQLEQDHRHRDHRDHDDDHEEEPETAPEARSAELKAAHRGCRKARALRTTSWQLQSLVHGAGQKTCLTPPSLGAIAQLGERLDRTQEVGGSSPPSSIPRTPAAAGVLLFRPPIGASELWLRGPRNGPNRAETAVTWAHFQDDPTVENAIATRHRMPRPTVRTRLDVPRAGDLASHVGKAIVEPVGRYWTAGRDVAGLAALAGLKGGQR